MPEISTYVWHKKNNGATGQWYYKMLQVKIIFRLKFFNLGWFSISFVS